MGITKLSQEIKVQISPKRFFKAMVTESETNLPKVIPKAIKSVEILHGDGGAGTIRKTTFADGSAATYKIHALETENYECKFSMIEGSTLGDKLESIHFDQKIVDTKDGGCIVKLETEYHTKGDVQLSDDEIKVAKEQNIGYYSLAEETLLANPSICT
ncbi:hypothetical protein ABFS83_14G030200 [Erythranthe nasuta]